MANLWKYMITSTSISPPLTRKHLPLVPKMPRNPDGPPNDQLFNRNGSYLALRIKVFRLLQKLRKEKCLPLKTSRSGIPFDGIVVLADLSKAEA